MKTLVVVNQKGGVGKTTLVVNLAHYMARRGLKVVVVDIDVQGDSSFAFEEQASGAVSSPFFLAKTAVVPEVGEGITLVAADERLLDVDGGGADAARAAERFKKRMDEIARQGADLCLIDAPPAIGVRLYAALAAADFVISPIEVETFSIKGINLLLRTIQTILETNPDLQFLGMVPNKVDARNPRHVAGLDELREAYGEYVFPFSIGLRSSISEAAVTGEPIWRNPKTSARAAKRELQALADHVYGRVMGGDHV